MGKSIMQSLYKVPIAWLRVNEYGTDWFPTPSGVKQGDALSPTLFALFTNDLAKSFKQLNIGVRYDDEISI